MPVGTLYGEGERENATAAQAQFVRKIHYMRFGELACRVQDFVEVGQRDSQVPHLQFRPCHLAT